MFFKRTASIGIAGLLSACGGGATTSVIPTANNSDFLDSGTSLTYNVATAETARTSSELQYINGTSTTSTVTPYEAINAHKAYGYGLSGAGEIIAIVDSRFHNQHQELDSKSPITFGTFNSVNNSSYHGLSVASIAAGEADSSGIQGVAPAANLHLSDYTRFGYETYIPNRWAALTADAAAHDAVAQNNSWGVDYMMSSLQTDIQNNGWTNAHGMAQKLNNEGYTADAASVTAYVQALNTFQQKGVVIYAVSNTSSYTDADIQAAMPELFPELSDAWLSTVNINITGNSSSLSYALQSAPCGSTAAYCLGADATHIRAASYQNSQNSDYVDNISGTSYAAPQVSGAIALLAEAFPNHTPAQLTDRLLASANNDFFSATAYTTFSNGVQHGYNSQYGHGFLDIYAALNPIVNTGSPRMVTGSNLVTNSNYTIQNSGINLSSAFGNSLSRGVQELAVYAYDDLNAGFAVPLQNLVNTASTGNQALPTQMRYWQTHLTSDYNAAMEANNQLVPYLATNPNSVKQTSHYNQAYGNLFTTAELSRDQTTAKVDHTKLSFGWQTPSYTRWQVRATGGLDTQRDNLLGLTGTGAFNLDESWNNSSFVSLDIRHQITASTHLEGFYTAAISNMGSPQDSLIHSAQDITSNSFSLGASHQQWLGQDQVSLHIRQPHRINSGNMTIKLADLADSSGNIKTYHRSIPLSLNGRQLDLDLGYSTWLRDNIKLSLSHTTSLQPEHLATAASIQQGFLGLSNDFLEFGIAHNQSNHKTQYILRLQNPK